MSSEQDATTVQICTHLGVQFAPDLLINAGIKPAEKVKNGYRWKVSDLGMIVEAVKQALDDAALVRFNPESKAVRPRKVKAETKEQKKVTHDPLNDEDDDGSL